MYIPNHYKNENINEVKEFLKQNSFGILISSVNGKHWGTHIPLELEKDELGGDSLYGHISKNNPQWDCFKENEEVLAIFNGPHAYVSSSWYNHENVPTWNYIAVHVYGKLSILNEQELMGSLKRLVDKYESNSENPVKVDKLSENTLKSIKGIVGFKIKIENIHSAYKLSQNRNDEDHHNIVKELQNTKDYLSMETSEIMENNRKLKNE